MCSIYCLIIFFNVVMKKKLFMAVAVGAIGMFAVANYCNNVADSTNDLLVANVEALADNESGGGDKTCTYNKVSKDEEKHELKCTGKGSQCCKLD